MRPFSSWTRTWWISWLLIFAGIVILTPGVRAADEIVTDCSSEAQLRAKLQAMQSTGGGTLTFACGTATIVLTGGVLPSITTSTMIDGGGTIVLSGGNTTRVFYVNQGATLTLNNITIVRGYWASGDGGAIRNHGTLNINNSKFSENQTSSNWSGGAIVTYGPTHIANSEFANNKAANGAAIYARYSEAVTTIMGSTLHHNTAMNPAFSQGRGGAVLLWDGAPMTIISSTLESNLVENSGAGGAVVVTANSSLTITGSSISDNQAGFGGGIFNFSGGTLTLSDSTLAMNSAETGGALDNMGTMNLTNVTIYQNVASKGSGGGIFNENTAALTNVTLSNNSAKFDGGGIYHTSNKPGHTVTLKNTILDNNLLGGNCYNNPGSINVMASTGYNLSSDGSCIAFMNYVGDQNNSDPLLGLLADNGGATLTLLPKAGSPAIDTGTSDRAPAADQRGVARPQGAAWDKGAVEVVVTPPPTSTPVPSSSVIYAPAVMK